MKLDRRAFIGGIAGVGIMNALLGGEHNAESGDVFVFLSDLHIDGRGQGMLHQNRRLEKTIDEILQLSPRPKAVVCFGDIACSYGLAVDYAEAKRILDRLDNAGIALHFVMGNHDRRSTFFEKWPQCAGKFPVPGRCVSVVDLGFADMVLLDALKRFDGTILIVSHDRYFLKELATRVFELDRGKLTVYEGDYSYYLEKSPHISQIVR